jgi:hypothetical protein
MPLQAIYTYTVKKRCNYKAENFKNIMTLQDNIFLILITGTAFSCSAIKG